MREAEREADFQFFASVIPESGWRTLKTYLSKPVRDFLRLSAVWPALRRAARRLSDDELALAEEFEAHGKRRANPLRVLRAERIRRAKGGQKRMDTLRVEARL